MPAYNAQKYIAQSIESVLKQNYLNFELVIVDDGSKDNTLSIINLYAGLDHRIKVFSLGSNIGLAKVRNYATSVATGKYIALLDSDDICSKNRFIEQIRILEIGMCDVCVSEYYTLDMNSGKKRYRKRYESDADLRALLTIYNPICNSTAMMLRDTLIRYPYQENLDGGPEDYDLWVRLAMAGYTFWTVKSALVTYRLHQDQVSRQKEELMLKLFNLIRLKYLEYLGFTYVPQRLPFFKRWKEANLFIKIIKANITGVSGSVNREIYARFQYRGNGIFTPLIRLERWIRS